VYQPPSPTLSDSSILDVNSRVTNETLRNISRSYLHKRTHLCRENFCIATNIKPLEILREHFKNVPVVMVCTDNTFTDRPYTSVAFIDNLQSHFINRHEKDINMYGRTA
jgi:hypothetical protein